MVANSQVEQCKYMILYFLTLLVPGGLDFFKYRGWGGYRCVPPMDKLKGDKALDTLILRSPVICPDFFIYKGMKVQWVCIVNC